MCVHCVKRSKIGVFNSENRTDAVQPKGPGSSEFRKYLNSTQYPGDGDGKISYHSVSIHVHSIILATAAGCFQDFPNVFRPMSNILMLAQEEGGGGLRFTLPSEYR